MFDGPLSLSFNYEVVYNDTNLTSIPVGPYNTYSFENSEELNFYFTVNCSETDFVQINGYIMNFSQ